MSNTTLSASEFEQIKGQYDEVALRSHSINTRCYTDRKFLQVEREQIFHRSWQFLCHEEKLREPGSYITLNLEGQSPCSRCATSEGELKALLQRVQASRA